MKLTKWQLPIMVTGYLFKSAALIGLLSNLVKIHLQKKRWILTNSFIAALRILNMQSELRKVITGSILYSPRIECWDILVHFNLQVRDWISPDFNSRLFVIQMQQALSEMISHQIFKEVLYAALLRLVAALNFFEGSVRLGDFFPEEVHLEMGELHKNLICILMIIVSSPPLRPS